MKIKCSEFDSEPFRRRGTLFWTIKQKKIFGNSFWNMMMLWKVFLLLLFWFAEFCSVLFRTLEWANPRHPEFRERSSVFHGITKTVPSLFLGIFSERNFYGNHICTAPSFILFNPILQSVLASSKIREWSATNMRRAEDVYKASPIFSSPLPIHLKK